MVVVFLCCPEVQAAVQDFVRDGKRNYLLTSKMPVMSKICCLALRFLSILPVRVLGAGVEGSSVPPQRVALCHSWLQLHSLSFPGVPLLAAPQFPWRARSRAAPGQGREILGLLNVVGSKFRGFDQKRNLPHWARVFQENFPMERGLCLLESLLGCLQRQD